MNFSSTISSSFFSYSLAQYIIIDIGIPTPAHITENILSAIQNVVCLRPSRIPAIGVALVNSMFQSVVSLSPTDTQLRRIVHALKSVMDSGKCRARIPMEEFNDNIHVGVKKALEDYDNLYKMCQKENHQASIAGLQITIFSMKNGFEIKMKLEQSLNLLSIKKLKQIQVIELTEEYMQPEPNRNYSGIPRFVEHICMPGSQSRLDELVKQWLVLREYDQEHVQIILQDSVILCDIRECVVLPSTMLQASCHNEVRILAVEVLQLEVTHRLSSDGLSETEMFGDPIALVPSLCRQLDGADRERNKQYFIALSEKLMTANEYLVAKSEVNKLLKYFVLLPGEGMLLLKMLTTSEIAMPSTDIHNQFVTQEVDCHVSESLLALPCLDSYTPAEFPTGLYRQLVQSALSENLQRNSPPTPVYHDPSHESVVVGIEIKKTTKRKKTSGGKSKKSASYDLPKLTSSDQQTLDEYFASKKRQKNKTCKMFRQ
uniref:Ku domain-containing protein n=1 Tax=Cuerna arida TaxID=1464854 RepID=A0A1B6G9P3_9HEMI